MRPSTIPKTAFALLLAATTGCDQPMAPEIGAATSVHSAANPRILSLELCALNRTDFTLESTNDYFPLGVGSEWTLRGEEEGSEIEAHITVLDETELVGQVLTRVVEEREWEDGGLKEVSRNFFAATGEGAICYFGEDVDDYENGEIVSHEGVWRADLEGNFPGIFLPPDPRPGMTFQMEGASGVAEDMGKIVGIGPVKTPAGTFRETIRLQERNPLDGGMGFKVFAKGIGLVIDGPLSLVSP